MGRREHFNVGHGWSFPVDPQKVVDRTMSGGFTVDLKTGAEPTTGTMVSIPGYEKPVPTAELTPESVISYGEQPATKELLSSPDMFLGTWRSSDDPEIGDAAFLDVSKNYSDSPAGAQAARKAAMEGDQWALYNIDRNMFEKNITKPEVVEGIKENNKLELTQESIDEYPKSGTPVGEGMALGYLTEPDVIRTRGGRKKTVAGTGQMTFLELGEKAN